MAGDRTVYCSEVAKKLNSQPHKCSQIYFLTCKSRQMHRLRAYSLDNPDHIQYLHRVFSLHPLVARSTQTLINDGIETAIGGVHFEMCDNLRRRTNKLLARPKDIAPSSNATAITASINTDTTTRDDSSI